jgi:hypothetical protein
MELTIYKSSQISNPAREESPSTTTTTWKFMRLPFHYNPMKAVKLARLHRLKRKGLTPATDKQSMRDAAIQVALAHPVRRF